MPGGPPAGLGLRTGGATTAGALENDAEPEGDQVPQQADLGAGGRRPRAAGVVHGAEVAGGQLQEMDPDLGRWLTWSWGGGGPGATWRRRTLEEPCGSLLLLCVLLFGIEGSERICLGGFVCFFLFFFTIFSIPHRANTKS